MSFPSELSLLISSGKFPFYKSRYLVKVDSRTLSHLRASVSDDFSKYLSNFLTILMLERMRGPFLCLSITSLIEVSYSATDCESVDFKLYLLSVGFSADSLLNL